MNILVRLFKRTIVVDCQNCTIVQDTMNNLKNQQKENDKKQMELLNALINTVGGLSENISGEVKEDNKRIVKEIRDEVGNLRKEVNKNTEDIELIKKDVEILKRKIA